VTVPEDTSPVEPVEHRPEPVEVASSPSTAITEVLPGGTQPSESTGTTLVVEVPPKRKRKRWPIVLAIVLVGTVGLLVAAFLIGDAIARDYAIGYVKQRIIEVLALPEDTPIQVTLGEGSIIMQALGGAINEVDVRADQVSFGELTGDATIHATKVPLDGSVPVDQLRITMTITEEHVRDLAASLSGLDLKSIELDNEVIKIASEFNLFNIIVIPVAVDLAPGASAGGITFDPVTVYLGEDPISVADLRNNPEFSALAGDLLRTQTVCVANSLPQVLAVDGVKVVGSDLVVSVNGDGVALADPALGTMGTCG
jgi:hypothetical protein